MQAWRIEVEVRESEPDPAGNSGHKALERVGLRPTRVRSKRGFLLGSGLSDAQVRAFARAALCDPVLETFSVHAPGAASPHKKPGVHRVSVLLRAGVTDPVAHSVQKALADMGMPVVEAATYRVYEAEGVEQNELLTASRRALANAVVNDVLADALPESLPKSSNQADVATHPIPLAHLDDKGLEQLSKDGGLALDANEMLAVQRHFAQLGRAPNRMELETIAQTWSEHCKHKTLTGRVRFEGKVIENLLKSTIAHVTNTLKRDFCVSVFVDNAGIIKFDDVDSVCIKVETHNRPSAIEPFGGAGTGVGGVIRDVLGTGLGARPIANTDVFCFAPPDLAKDKLPAGCLHPRTVLSGVVSGVRDYGNPMGIPTVNGSIHFDEDFVGNPLVYVGNIGMLPTARAHKQVLVGDAIVALGGRTGRDGIHGATFSSLGLHTKSESVSSGAVQIGDPIAERKVMDAVLALADRDLFSAITDCGAGGFSSAIGEMSEGLGAEVELAGAPLKYDGLAPWEIWISEAQERMVLSVPQHKLDAVLAVCKQECCEAVVLGRFTNTGKLIVKYAGTTHADLDLHFLHKGLPIRERIASYVPAKVAEPDLPPEKDLGGALLALMSDYSICSKEWVIRQYDHEVQAASAGKPLCGPREDGPADAAVLAPKLGSLRGVVLGNGLNPRYSKIDPAAMAECALDEAMRNVVATGADPDYTAVLDNYCWSNTNNEQRLGELVRASYAITDLALAYRTPFVSGKDSLHNQFKTQDRLIEIPGCILVTAMSVIADVTKTVNSALAHKGSKLVLTGITKDELGGSTYYKTKGVLGANVPRVDAQMGKKVLHGVHRAIQQGLVKSAHDCSEGGLAVAAAEMAIAGKLGVRIDLDAVQVSDALRSARPECVMFSESQSRILLEVPADKIAELKACMKDAPFSIVGEVTGDADVRFARGESRLATVSIAALERAWKTPLDLDGTLCKEIAQ